MNKFIRKHASVVTGVLSRFDCVLFRGTFRFETTLNNPGLFKACRPKEGGPEEQKSAAGQAK